MHTIDTNTPTSSSAPAAGWDAPGYIAVLRAEGERFALLAETGDLDAAIAACPGWDARDLVKHVGLVHLWAAANLAFPSDAWITVREMDDLADYWPELTWGWPDDSEIVPWYRAALATLIRVLEGTPSDHRCLTFLPAPDPLTMWARRQACEVGVHRFDLEAALGVPSRFDPRFAADMLDELLTGFAPGKRSIEVDGTKVIHIHCTDVDEHYSVSMSADGTSTERSASTADLTITGSAADINLLLWNRPAGPTISLSGDERLLDVWSEAFRIRWR